MKKILTTLLSLALLCMMSVTAFAASPITSANGNDAVSVKGTYVAGSAGATVYSVDIAWGSMEFTYTDASAGTWDPQNHTYNGAVAAAWSCAEEANKITVTNHSNAAVTAKLSYSPEIAYSRISGTFSNSTLNLNSAVGTEVATAPSGSAWLSLNGELSAKTVASTKIGTVTVSLGD